MIVAYTGDTSQLPEASTGKLKATFPDPGPITRQGTLNLIPLHVAGKKAKAEDTKNFQKSVDHIIMRLMRTWSRSKCSRFTRVEGTHGQAQWHIQAE